MEKKKTKDRKETTELLNFVSEEVDYTDSDKISAQRKAEEELAKRKPFSDMKRAIERQQLEIGALREIVEKLVSHEHGADGKPTIPIRKKHMW